jgi:NAD(P)-dependent dehydrogenase (short-subunit alcohol dehydrogenase family)
MRHIVITGGTDGLGRALGLECLRRGDEVTVVGSSEPKGRTFLAAAAGLGAAQRATFMRADLSLVAENRRVISELAARLATVDALVLCARYFRATRHSTSEGFESTFALFHLSRFLFTHGLASRLAKSRDGVILDLAGPGGPLSHMNWEDPQFVHGYRPQAVMAQCGKLSDLNAVAFAGRHRDSPIRYVLLHPGLTLTGFTGQYDADSAAMLADMKRRAQPVDAGVKRMTRHLDNPSTVPLAAFTQDTEVDVATEAFDARAAERLHRLTVDMLAGAGCAEPRP